MALDDFHAGGTRVGLPASFPDHIRELLEREIIDGRLAPGERVSEDELARKLGVSRTPVREAMRMLEERGLVVRQRGRGTSVARRTSPDEVEGLYELRVTLEGFLTARAASRIRAPELSTLRALQDEFRNALNARRHTAELAALVRIDSDFHWTIYEAAGTDLVSIVMSYWGRLQRELYARVYEPGHLEPFAEQHELIIAALEAHDSAAARTAMSEHIGSGWEVVRVGFQADAGRRQGTGSTE